MKCTLVPGKMAKRNRMYKYKSIFSPPKIEGSVLEVVKRFWDRAAISKKSAGKCRDKELTRTAWLGYGPLGSGRNDEVDVDKELKKVPPEYSRDKELTAGVVVVVTAPVTNANTSSAL